MLIEDYESIVEETCVVPADSLKIYSTLGLIGEVGEVVQHALNEQACKHAEELLVLYAAYHLGQMAERVKKHRRDGVFDTVNFWASWGKLSQTVQQLGNALPGKFPVLKHITPPEPAGSATKELGDVLWYLAARAKAEDVSLAAVAEENMTKLRDRKARGVIQGSGDER